VVLKMDSLLIVFLLLLRCQSTGLNHWQPSRRFALVQGDCVRKDVITTRALGS